MISGEEFRSKFSVVVDEVLTENRAVAPINVDVSRLDVEYRSTIHEAQLMGREAAQLLVSKVGIEPDLLVPRAEWGPRNSRAFWTNYARGGQQLFNVAQADQQAWRLPVRQLGSKFRPARSADDPGVTPEYFYAHPVIVENHGLCISPPFSEDYGDPDHYRQYDADNSVSQYLKEYRHLDVRQSIEIEREVQRDIARLLIRYELLS
jgi:hypothetical protein